MSEKSFTCTKCNRCFFNLRGLKSHDRSHTAIDHDRNNDEEYKLKRIANNKSVRLHRQLHPKIRYEDLVAETKQALLEAELLIEYLKANLPEYHANFERKIHSIPPIDI